MFLMNAISGMSPQRRRAATGCMKALSVAAACRFKWRLSAELKPCRKARAPSRGRVDGGVAWVEQSSFSISCRKILDLDAGLGDDA